MAIAPALYSPCIDAVSGLGELVMAFERREVRFTGRVQGVGFRYTTQRLARGYQLTGFVQNLPDGKVLLVAEGDAAEIDGFLAAIRAEMGSHIDHTHVLRSDYQGSFREFEIRY